MGLVDNQANFNLNLDLGDVDSIDSYAVAGSSEPRSGSTSAAANWWSEWWPDDRVASEGHLIGAQGQLQRSRYPSRSPPVSPAEGSGSDDLE
jgi:hypothetical protein